MNEGREAMRLKRESDCETREGEWEVNERGRIEGLRIENCCLLYKVILQCC